MNNITPSKLKELVKELEEQINQSEPDESKNWDLGKDILDKIETYLNEKPNDFEIRFLRLKTIDLIDENAESIIEESTYIIENASNHEDINAGYNWLSWVYLEKLGMTKKAIETIEEQLIEVHRLFENKLYRRHQIAGFLLEKMAIIKRDEGDTEEYINLCLESFEKHPHIDARNGYIGLKLLERNRFEEAEKLLTLHFIFNYNSNLTIEYGNLLKKLLNDDQLEAHPNLIGMYFAILRNNFESFKIKNEEHFYKLYFQEILQYAEKYKTNSWLWSVVANTLFFNEEYRKALRAYLRVIEGDNSNRENYIDRIHECCEETGYDFFSIPFKIEGQSYHIYAILSSLNDLYDETNDIRYLDLAIEFGEVGYKQYYDYLYEGKGSSYNNQPHVFAMLCNNFTISLLDKALELPFENQKEPMTRITKIHQQGYDMSPFEENIKNAIDPAYYAEMYEECIKLIDIYFDEYVDFEDEDSDDEDILEKKRIRQSCLYKLENKNVFEAIDHNNIENLFGETQFSDHQSLQQQIPSFKTMFAMLEKDFVNQTYHDEERRIFLGWNDYSISISKIGEIYNLLVSGKKQLIIFQYYEYIEKGFLGLSKTKKEILVLKHSKPDEEFEEYNFKSHPEILAIANQVWAEVLNRLKLGTAYYEAFNKLITPQKVLDLLNVSVIKEKYHDYWDSDNMGFRIADCFLIFCQNGVVNGGYSYTGKFVVSRSNRKPDEKYDTFKYYFHLNRIENPTIVYLSYISSQEGNAKDRYNSESKYVSVLDWEIYRDALQNFVEFLPFIAFENELYLAEQRKKINLISENRLYEYVLGDTKFELLSRVEAESILMKIKDFKNNAPIDIFHIDYDWQDNKIFKDEYFLYTSDELVLENLDLCFQPDDFNILGYIFEKDITINNIVYAEGEPIIPSFIALENAVAKSFVVDGGVHYINKDFNCALFLGKNKGLFIVKEKIFAKAIISNGLEFQLGDFECSIYEDYETNAIKIWGTFLDEKGDIALRELYPFQPTNKLDNLIPADFLEDNIYMSKFVNHQKVIDFDLQNPDLTIVDLTFADVYLKDFDENLASKIRKIFEHNDTKNLKTGELQTILRRGNPDTYFYFYKPEGAVQVGFWNLEKHYVNFLVMYNSGAISWNINFYETDNQTVRFTFETQTTDPFAITESGKRMFLEAEDILFNADSKLRVLE